VLQNLSLFYSFKLVFQEIIIQPLRYKIPVWKSSCLEKVRREMEDFVAGDEDSFELDVSFGNHDIERCVHIIIYNNNNNINTKPSHLIFNTGTLYAATEKLKIFLSTIFIPSRSTRATHSRRIYTFRNTSTKRNTKF
jgi:hypothetical protein